MCYLLQETPNGLGFSILGAVVPPPTNILQEDFFSAGDTTQRCLHARQVLYNEATPLSLLQETFDDKTDGEGWRLRVL